MNPVETKVLENIIAEVFDNIHNNIVEHQDNDDVFVSISQLRLIILEETAPVTFGDATFHLALINAVEHHKFASIVYTSRTELTRLAPGVLTTVEKECTYVNIV